MYFKTSYLKVDIKWGLKIACGIRKEIQGSTCYVQRTGQANRDRGNKPSSILQPITIEVQNLCYIVYIFISFHFTGGEILKFIAF